jgi:RNA polymerase sigma-70 factor (ECF subfamily)
MAQPETAPIVSIESFESVVRRCRKQVITAAYRITGDIDDARDVAQFTFLQFFLKAPPLADLRSVERWLYVVTRNEALSVTRRRLREVQAAAADGIPAPQPDLAETIARHDRAVQVRATISELSPGDRHIIELRHFHAMPSDEMATRLGVPVGQVRRRVEHARWRLRACMLRRGLDREVLEL